jgi:two-component sensor histidine kinase
MNDSGSLHDSGFQYPPSVAFNRDLQTLTRIEQLTAELDAALAREQNLLRDKEDLLRRPAILAQEFDHRLLNSLQLIASLLSLQSRSATPEAAAQLIIAACRVAAFGRVHHQLHLLDHQDRVEFKHYLEHLCADISKLLFEDQIGSAIVVEGTRTEIPTKFAIPLGFIVNELITNSAKYAKGKTTVRLEERSPDRYSLSVSDDGPGLPAGFVPAASTGLGMTIVQSLARQIGGELQVSTGDDGRGACFTITFCSPAAPTGGRRVALD